LGSKVNTTKFFDFILTLSLVSGVAFARGYEVNKMAGEYEAEVRIDRGPLSWGVTTSKLE